MCETTSIQKYLWQNIVELAKFTKINNQSNLKN